MCALSGIPNVLFVAAKVNYYHNFSANTRKRKYQNKLLILIYRWFFGHVEKSSTV